MGCDIHILIETRRNNNWRLEKEFDMNRSYGTFGFMADVRNYSCVPSLGKPIHIVPNDASKEVKEIFDWSDHHNLTVLNLKELIDFDYSKTFEDRRCMRNGNGASICEPGEGKIVTFQDFLSPDFFKLIEEMKSFNLNPQDVRIIFDFDN